MVVTQANRPPLPAHFVAGVIVGQSPGLLIGGGVLIGDGPPGLLIG